MGGGVQHFLPRHCLRQPVTSGVKVHAPRRVSAVSVRRICLESPVAIGFQANGFVSIPSVFVEAYRAALVAAVSPTAPTPPTRRRVPARDGRGERDSGPYLCKPSAFSVS